MYVLNTKSTLDNLTSKDYFVTMDNINNPNYVLIDVRSQFEFDKGHLENTINIYTPEILNETNLAIFTQLNEAGKTAVLYANNPEELNTPFLILSQLGYNNIKLLEVKNNYLQNKLITTPIEVEKSQADVSAFIKESAKNANIIVPIKVVTPVKKVITIQKKKKAPAEGCC